MAERILTTGIKVNVVLEYEQRGTVHHFYEGDRIHLKLKSETHTNACVITSIDREYINTVATLDDTIHKTMLTEIDWISRHYADEVKDNCSGFGCKDCGDCPIEKGVRL